MTEPPLVTVVIPTWNRAGLVQQAIASVLSQTHARLELIVVDDGSTDETAKRIGSLDDPRLEVMTSPHTGNIGRLRNLGAAAGSGEWIAFLDSDDIWLPEKLEIQLKALSETGADWCYCDCSLMSADGDPVPMQAGQFRPLSGWILDGLLADRTGACVDTLVVRRSVFESIGGFDERFSYLEDLDFELRLALAAEAAAVGEALVRVRDHAGRGTAELQYPHEHAARLYEHFARQLPAGKSARLAKRRRAYHLAEAGAARIARRQVRLGSALLVRALLLGCGPAHGLRTIARGVRTAALRPLRP